MDYKWVRGVFAALLLAVLAMFTGCGKDGNPGSSYLGVWMESTQADEISYMSCSFLPSTYIYGLTVNGVPASDTVYYQQSEGTYYYEYQLRWWDTLNLVYHYSYVWYGSLSITIENGENGSFPFVDGKDGADIFYDWVLGWNGSTLYYDRIESAGVSPRGKTTLSSLQGSNTLPLAKLQKPDPALYDIGPAHVVTKSNGVYRMTITEYPCSPKGAATTPPKANR